MLVGAGLPRRLQDSEVDGQRDGDGLAVTDYDMLRVESSTHCHSESKFWCRLFPTLPRILATLGLMSRDHTRPGLYMCGIAPDSSADFAHSELCC